MEGDGDNENDNDGQDPQNPKTSTHLCGSMSLSLVEGKGVEQGNLYATIVIKTTQVPIPV
jgi:hypothetical protein